MQIILITPAPPSSKAGNRTTAARWENILESLGHEVEVATEYTDQAADLMIALHAWRSAESIERFAADFPQKPLVVAITGTDAYRFIHSHPETTLRSIELADQLVGLHDLISNTLPEKHRDKMQVIYQSAPTIPERKPYTRYFHVAVLGHLREEKDPLRPALAARHLPEHSRIQIHHYGKAQTQEWAEKSQAEMQINPRYHWHGEISHAKIRRLYRRTHLLILPSRMEGGANVISEAIVAGVPIIASNIEGSIGLLGANYPGYYPVENEKALAKKLLRAEQDVAFYQSLEIACQAKQALFTLQKETQAWQDLIQKLSVNIKDVL